MKRSIIFWAVILLCVGNTKIRPAQAYTVTLQKDGMYAEVIPDTIIDNAPALFQKSVTKALKYENKYKDADAVTRANKIPHPYDKFIEIAKKIRSSDEIVIRNPFCIYNMWDEMEGAGPSKYYLEAQRNGKKLCYFSLDVDETDHKIRFYYDKPMNQYFKYDENTMKDALFYELDSITYAETPDKVYEVRDQQDRGSLGMTGSNLPDLEKKEKKFRQKDYNEKKDEIFSYLARAKKDGVSRKTVKNLKLELKDDYVESESGGGDTGIWKLVCPAAGIGVLVIVAVFLLVGKWSDNLLMKYILKNIKSFAKDYTKIFVLLIITIMASTLIIHLSYGMFREYKERKALSRSATNEIVFRLKGSYVSGANGGADGAGLMTVMGDLEAQRYEKREELSDVTAGDMKRFAGTVDQDVAGKLLNIHTGILEGKYRFDTDFLIDHGRIINSGDYGPDSLYNYTFGSTTTNIFQYGRYFSDREYAHGDRVCIMYGFQKEPRGDYLKKNMTDSGTVMIGGKEYEIIGLQNGIGTGFLPITAVGEKAVLLDQIDMRFKDNISLREINLLIKAAEECFGDRVECNYDLQETEGNDYLYNTILLLVLVVSVVAAFNFCALYHYIVTTRQRTLRIFRVCGLSHSRSLRLYLGECSILSVGTYLVTLLLFRYVLMPFLAVRWNVFDFHFPAEVYVMLFAIFFVSSFVLQYILILWTLKKKMVR